MNCIICGANIPKGYRKYCSIQCRNKRNNDYRTQSGRGKEHQKRKREAIASIPSDKKKRCAICGGWYVQVATHVRQAHGMSAREYKEQFNLPLKRGISPAWYREMKGRQAKENGTCNNLKKGKKFRYKKGDPRASVNTGWKGRRYKPDELYG